MLTNSATFSGNFPLNPVPKRASMTKSDPKCKTGLALPSHSTSGPRYFFKLAKPAPFKSFLFASKKTLTFAFCASKCRAATSPSPPLFPLPHRTATFFLETFPRKSAAERAAPAPAFSIKSPTEIFSTSIASRSKAAIWRSVGKSIFQTRTERSESISAFIFFSSVSAFSL